MLSGKGLRPMVGWRVLFSILILVPGLCLSGFVDASHAVMDINGTLTKSFTSIIPDSAKVISEAELSPTGTMLTEIKIQVKERVIAPELSVQKYDSKPADTTTGVPGEVYRYMFISSTNLEDSNIQSANIKFKVGKDWLVENNLDASSVALYRYAGGAWSKLDTAKSGEDGLYDYYEAATPGFSYFAISASGAVATTTTTLGSEPSGSTPGAWEGGWTARLRSWWAGGVVAAFLIAAAIALTLGRKPPVVKRRRRARSRFQKA